MKEAWENKSEMLEKGATLAIEQLSEALSTTANSCKLSDDLSENSTERCAEQARFVFVLFKNLNCYFSFWNCS